MQFRANGACVRAYAPGRIELAGNHVDHQGGRVIAATVDCGIEMTVSAQGDARATVCSEGFPHTSLDMGDASPRDDEKGTTAALVRGVVAGLRAEGVAVGGFSAQVRSDVPAGGGLSSSAAFELALCQGLGLLFGEGPVDPLRAALIGQAAEREWFGKPCGLMDQLSIALGGVTLMDFRDAQAPVAEGVSFSVEEYGYVACLVDVHSDHSAYTDEYARIPRDMAAVAALFGKERLADVDEERFLTDVGAVRSRLGDVAVLRAVHFFREMRSVDRRARAMREGDIGTFLEETRRSGASSAQFLQNVSCFGSADQPAMVALALADGLLDGEGACRIHGGGFGGTVQAFVPQDRFAFFKRAMDRCLGGESCRPYEFSTKGARSSWIR